jgi:hypothetical protein
MHQLRLMRTRLELVAGTLELALAEIASPIGWAFAHPYVRMVIAHTLPGFVASIRVMEKYGMQTIRYELARHRFQPPTP